VVAAVTTGQGRVWTSLWKPLIDSLGPILGEHPTGRSTPTTTGSSTLALHHTVDPQLGFDVHVAISWQPATT
jgi:hypothetical protein